MAYTSKYRTSHRATTLGARLGLCAAVLILGALPGCGDPCRDLSDTICNCLPTRSEQQACRKRVHALAAQGPTSNPSKNEQSVCQNLLDTCTCAALAEGNFAACGLARD